jgi:hypothetical protein
MAGPEDPCGCKERSFRNITEEWRRAVPITRILKRSTKKLCIYSIREDTKLRLGVAIYKLKKGWNCVCLCTFKKISSNARRAGLTLLLPFSADLYHELVPITTVRSRTQMYWVQRHFHTCPSPPSEDRENFPSLKHLAYTALAGGGLSMEPSSLCRLLGECPVTVLDDFPVVHHLSVHIVTHGNMLPPYHLGHAVATCPKPWGHGLI